MKNDVNYHQWQCDSDGYGDDNDWLIKIMIMMMIIINSFHRFQKISASHHYTISVYSTIQKKKLL